MYRKPNCTKLERPAYQSVRSLHLNVQISLINSYQSIDQCTQNRYYFVYRIETDFEYNDWYSNALKNAYFQKICCDPKLPCHIYH